MQHDQMKVWNRRKSFDPYQVTPFLQLLPWSRHRWIQTCQRKTKNREGGVFTQAINRPRPQYSQHSHSLFELISGSSDWPCISTFDLISFLVQQLLPVLLRPADLADPGSWKEEGPRVRWWFINSEDTRRGSLPTFPFIAFSWRDPPPCTSQRLP